MTVQRWNYIRPVGGLALILILSLAAWGAAGAPSAASPAAAGVPLRAAPEVQPEIIAFFDRFYAARTVPPGTLSAPDALLSMTELTYRDYLLATPPTRPGGARAVSYTDLAVEIASWDPTATPHGGITEVTVAYTAQVQVPGGWVQAQPGQEQFRVHRHLAPNGHATWFAVDFFDPLAGQWVSESAGLAGPVPADLIT